MQSEDFDHKTYSDDLSHRTVRKGLHVSRSASSGDTVLDKASTSPLTRSSRVYDSQQAEYTEYKEIEQLPIKALLLVDTQTDIDTIVSAFTNTGINLCSTCVATEQAYQDRLQDGPDVIIALTGVSQLDCDHALKILNDEGFTIPFFVICDNEHEKAAFLSLRAGATDYFLKQNLNWLPAFVQQAIHYQQLQIEKLKAEEELHLSEERRRLALRGSNDGIWDTDLITKQVFFSHHWQELRGYPPEDSYCSREEWQALVHPEDLQRTLETIDEHFTNRSPFYTCEYRVLCHDGSYRWILSRGQALRDTTGQAIRMAGTIKDIHKRKQSEEMIHKMLEYAPDAIVMVDKEGKIAVVNSQTERLFGYQRHELLGQAIEILLPERFHHNHISYRSKYLRNQHIRPMGTNLEVFGRTKAGNEFPAEVSLSPLGTADGPLVMSTIRDVTARKLLESQLALAQKLESIGQLAAGVAHELNTPTQYVGDNIHFLQETFGDLLSIVHYYERVFDIGKQSILPPELVAETEEKLGALDIAYLAAEIPQAIQQSLMGIERIASIVGAMKEFSHPGAQEKVATDLNRAISTTLTVARHEWKYVAEVQTDLDENLPLIPCSPGEINQALLNLIVNAAHAIADVVGDGSTQKGKITLSTRHDDTKVEIRIGDTGTGIPVALHGKIFDPFFTTKTVGKGTGQGLAIVRSVIVQKHGGTISFDSTVGQGTTFVIRLPLDGAPLSQVEPS